MPLVKKIIAFVVCFSLHLAVGNSVFGSCPTVNKVSDFIKSQNVSNCRFKPPSIFSQSKFTCRVKPLYNPVIGFVFSSSEKTKLTASSKSIKDSAGLKSGKLIGNQCTYESSLCINGSCHYVVIV